MKLENKFGIIAAGLIGLSCTSKQEPIQQEPTQDIECETVQILYNHNNRWTRRVAEIGGIGRPLRLCKYNVTGSRLGQEYKGTEYQLQIFYEDKGWDGSLIFSPGDNYVFPECRGSENE